MSDRKIPAKTSRRVEIERKIMIVFEAAREMEATKEPGIGKYTIKRSLMFNDKRLRLSINTVKRIVDEFVEKGLIECVNPEAKAYLKFRLVVTPCRSFDRKVGFKHE